MVGGPPKNVLNVNRSGYCLLSFTTYSALWVKKFKLAKADGPENNETIISYSSATVFTGRNEVVAKVIFLHLPVILFTGGGVSASVHAGMPHPSLDISQYGEIRQRTFS